MGHVSTGKSWLTHCVSIGMPVHVSPAPMDWQFWSGCRPQEVQNATVVVVVMLDAVEVEVKVVVELLVPVEVTCDVVVSEIVDMVVFDVVVMVVEVMVVVVFEV